MKIKNLRRLAAEMRLLVDKLEASGERHCLCALLDELEKELAPKTQPARLSDAEFMLELTRTFPGLDLDAEFRKMDLWLLVHPGRHKSREFMTNWLGRQIGKATMGKVTIPPPPDKTDPIGRGLWKRQHGDPKQYGYD